MEDGDTRKEREYENNLCNSSSGDDADDSMGYCRGSLRRL